MAGACGRARSAGPAGQEGAGGEWHCRLYFCMRSISIGTGCKPLLGAWAKMAPAATGVGSGILQAGSAVLQSLQSTIDLHAALHYTLGVLCKACALLPKQLLHTTHSPSLCLLCCAGVCALHGGGGAPCLRVHGRHPTGGESPFSAGPGAPILSADGMQRLCAEGRSLTACPCEPTCPTHFLLPISLLADAHCLLFPCRWPLRQPRPCWRHAPLLATAIWSPTSLLWCGALVPLYGNRLHCGVASALKGPPSAPCQSRPRFSSHNAPSPRSCRLETQVSCIARPAEVPDVIAKLSATTFVQV